ncbi:hypothetical protein EJB05_41526 [Eragrostis curvula]|uniref:Uncharacterized protein n=1 Tax=Eragrostis curvula TaxID=38414 RepID=A0A5J9TA77_9POAL|nr:hypothetical protein EJB05_41526 [Eragrostis curvula]
MRRAQGASRWLSPEASPSSCKQGICLTQMHMSLLVGNDGVQVDVMIDFLIWGLRHSIQKECHMYPER